MTDLARLWLSTFFEVLLGCGQAGYDHHRGHVIQVFIDVVAILLGKTEKSDFSIVSHPPLPFRLLKGYICYRLKFKHHRVGGWDICNWYHLSEMKAVASISSKASSSTRSSMIISDIAGKCLPNIR